MFFDWMTSKIIVRLVGLGPGIVFRFYPRGVGKPQGGFGGRVNGAAELVGEPFVGWVGWLVGLGWVGLGWVGLGWLVGWLVGSDFGAC